jgi:hypothetical protein
MISSVPCIQRPNKFHSRTLNSNGVPSGSFLFERFFCGVGSDPTMLSVARVFACDAGFFTFTWSGEGDPGAWRQLIRKAPPPTSRGTPELSIMQTPKMGPAPQK